MTTFLLVRHGMTDAVGNRIITGRRSGVHLNEQGREQAAELARALASRRIAAVYSSPLERAVETAGALAKALGCDVQERERLIEVDPGTWEGMSLDELALVPEWRQFNLFRSQTRSPGGEHMLDIQIRMVQEMEELRLRHMDEALILVSHGDVIRAAVAHYLGVALDLFLRLEISPASVSVIQLWEEGVRVPVINAGMPLPAALEF